MLSFFCSVYSSAMSYFDVVLAYFSVHTLALRYSLSNIILMMWCIVEVDQDFFEFLWQKSGYPYVQSHSVWPATWCMPDALKPSKFNQFIFIVYQITMSDLYCCKHCELLSWQYVYWYVYKPELPWSLFICQMTAWD